MSGSRPAPSAPTPALEALLADASGDPIRRALMLDALDRRLRPCLPPVLAAHARLANVSGHKLVFLVESPVWNAKLRLAEPELLDAARSVGLDVDAVVVRTATAPFHQPRPAERPAVPMSQASRDALRAALASLEAAPSGSAAGGKRRDEDSG
ncbi:DUF721 domain-containing protein [Luteimonas pelagia]